MLLRRGLTLEYVTLGWTVVGVVVLAIAAIAAGSVALAGFGVDRLIEIVASAVVVWQLKGEEGSDHERRALRIIAIAFVLLAMMVKLTALVLPLGLDTFAVAAALGVAGISPPRRLRVSFVMASFEALMPLVGLALGIPLGRAIGSDADYIAVAVLIGFGLYTLLGEEDENERVDTLVGATGWGAVLLGLSISLDELAIGFTLGILRLPVALVIALIGAQALLFSQLGMRLGAHLSSRLREGAERLAGLVLVALGVGLLMEKLLTG